MFVYLDNSATTKPYNEAVDVMTTVLREDFGNPSSLHTLGITAEKYIKNDYISLYKVPPGQAVSFCHSIDQRGKFATAGG